MSPCGPGLPSEFNAKPETAEMPANVEDHQRDGEDVEHDELHLRRLDLLAEVLRCAADHEAGDEHREEREDQHAVDARARTAGAHLAEHDVDERHRAAERQ